MFGDVTSANVVGYTATDTGDYQFMLGIGFEDVTGETGGVKLGDLVGDFEQGDNIQELYTQYDEETGGYSMEFNDFYYKRVSGKWGWYDRENKKASDKVFKAGSAVYFISNSDAKPVTQSGSVRKASFVHPAFDEMAEMISSAFPVGFNPSADTVHFEGLEQGDNIQVQYVYTDEETQEPLLGFTDYYYKRVSGKWGWYDRNNKKVTAPITNAGQGFYFFTKEGGDPADRSLTEDSPIAE